MRNGCTLDLEGIRQALSPFYEKSRVQKAIVFGSFARGTQDRHSDLDLILVMPTQERFLKRNADRPFFRRVLHEGKVIFERGKEQG